MDPRHSNRLCSPFVVFFSFGYFLFIHSLENVSQFTFYECWIVQFLFFRPLKLSFKSETQKRNSLVSLGYQAVGFESRDFYLPIPTLLCFVFVFIFQILIDTKVVQKEINQLSGKLDRTFSVTDELIFRVCICCIQLK